MSNHYAPGVFPTNEYTAASNRDWTTIITSVLLAVFIVQQILSWLDKPVLSIPELLWNALVYATPVPLLRFLRLLPPANKIESGMQTDSNGQNLHAEKSQALREALRLGTGRGALSRAGSHPSAPKGLGNWDNSCYQNSVLQAIASLPSLKIFFDSLHDTLGSIPETSTVEALKGLASQLNDLGNDTSFYWTPAKLKSMSSWQQQDAQEYFSKLMDAMEKDIGTELNQLSVQTEAFKLSLADSLPVTGGAHRDGFPNLKAVGQKRPSTSQLASAVRAPFDGLVAQRVGCTACGYCEGISLVPSNCLTVPLGKGSSYDLSECLNDFTELEYIDGVECAKCSLLAAKEELERMAKGLTATADQADGAETNFKLREILERRLEAVEDALDTEDFSEKTLAERCQIKKNLRRTSRKSRQSAIAREPKCLVVHINRSVFDEMTGALLKNYADVSYPMSLDLSPWSLGSCDATTQSSTWEMDPTRSMVPGQVAALGTLNGPYDLKAVISHQGRHENGHYICYRQSPRVLGQGDSDSESEPESKDDSTGWWRLSDERVSAVEEQDITALGSAFMLFYERRPDAALSDTGKVGTETCEVNLPQSSPSMSPEASATVATGDGED